MRIEENLNIFVDKLYFRNISFEAIYYKVLKHCHFLNTSYKNVYINAVFPPEEVIHDEKNIDI